jgi:hypothetical protein
MVDYAKILVEPNNIQLMWSIRVTKKTPNSLHFILYRIPSYKRKNNVRGVLSTYVYLMPSMRS